MIKKPYRSVNTAAAMSTSPRVSNMRSSSVRIVREHSHRNRLTRYTTHLMLNLKILVGHNMHLQQIKYVFTQTHIWLLHYLMKQVMEYSGTPLENMALHHKCVCFCEPEGGVAESGSFL